MRFNDVIYHNQLLLPCQLDTCNLTNGNNDENIILGKLDGWVYNLRLIGWLGVQFTINWMVGSAINDQLGGWECSYRLIGWLRVQLTINWVVGSTIDD